MKDVQWFFFSLLYDSGGVVLRDDDGGNKEQVTMTKAIKKQFTTKHCLIIHQIHLFHYHHRQIKAQQFCSKISHSTWVCFEVNFQMVRLKTDV